MYSPDSSEGEEEATLSRAPSIPPNLLRQQSSSRSQTNDNIIETLSLTILLKGFSPSNLQSNGLSIPNNNIENNSSTEHLPFIGYRHTVSPTSQHAHIVSSGTTFNEHGPAAQHAHPGSSNSIIATLAHLRTRRLNVVRLLRIANQNRQHLMEISVNP